MDYSKTLNLPKTDFPMKANLPAREPELQRRWQEMGLFQRLMQKPAPRGRFVLHDGPPYANGPIHLGTALQNKVPKDIIVRFHAMRGYRAPYVPGWDQHGMPIENNVSREFQQKKLQPTRRQVRARCREYAEHWTQAQKVQFQRFGIEGDWSHPYLTMDPAYEATIVRTFGRLAERGFIYRGLKPVHWCPRCRTALAEAEIEYEDHSSPSIYVRFPLSADPGRVFDGAEPASTIIWTTTPWTIPANLAVAVHPEFRYVVVEMDGARCLVAEGLLPAVSEKLGWSQPRVLKTLTGAELEGLVFRHPLFDRDSPMVAADYVTLDSGTGVVHTAPGHGREDFLTGRRYGLPVLCPVDEGGRFTAEAGERFAGLDLKAGNAAVIEALEEAGALLQHESYAHSYPHCWRCHGPVIFRATVQWFMSADHAGLRTRILDAVETIEWFPPEGKQRMLGMMSVRPDWCLSRQRSWGVGIPVFYCEGCGGELLTPDTVEAVATAVEAGSSDVWFDREAADLLPAGFCCPRCGASEFRKETDVLDVWFDSGTSCRAVLQARPELGYPADVYLEGYDQFRGWFNAALMIGMATEDAPPYRQVVTNGFTVDENGRKMSKSLGNVIDPVALVGRYGADVLRLLTGMVCYFEDLRVGEETLKRMADSYRRVRNTFRFLLGNLADFSPATHAVPYEQLPEIDRWALHRLQQVVRAALHGYEQHDFRPAMAGVHDFCATDLSAFYLDVLKDRLYASAPHSPERRAAQTALWELAHTLARVLAPVLVHTCEEAWDHLRRQDSSLAESVHLSDFPEPRPDWEDAGLAERWDAVLRARELVHKALEVARAEGRIGQPLEAHVALVCGGPVHAALAGTPEDLARLFVVSQAELQAGPNGAEPEARVRMASGTKCARCWLTLPTVGESAEHPDLCGRCAGVVTAWEAPEAAPA